MRKIIHIDMDCFYAAVEEREHPEWRDAPLAVGGGGRRGVLTTCNYNARRFGVRSAMPTFKALELCPDLRVVPPRFNAYREESRAIREIFGRYTPRIEPLSLDEAFLDVSAAERPGTYIARDIREAIWRERRLRASAGIAPNKMLAKIASDWNKPNGQFTVAPAQVAAFMRDLPVRRIPGVGPKTHQRLEALGVKTCGELQLWPLSRLTGLFGKFGSDLYGLCRGEDDREVEPDRERKSCSVERTFREDLPDLPSVLEEAPALIDALKKDLAALPEPRPVRKIFVKLKFSDFRQTTAEERGADLLPERFEALFQVAWERGRQPVRLAGVGVRFDELQLTARQLLLPFPGRAAAIRPEAGGAF